MEKKWKPKMTNKESAYVMKTICISEFCKRTINYLFKPNS